MILFVGKDDFFVGMSLTFNREIFFVGKDYFFVREGTVKKRVCGSPPPLSPPLWSQSPPKLGLLLSNSKILHRLEA